MSRKQRYLKDWSLSPYFFSCQLVVAKLKFQDCGQGGFLACSCRVYAVCISIMVTYRWAYFKMLVVVKFFIIIALAQPSWLYSDIVDCCSWPKKNDAQKCIDMIKYTVLELYLQLLKRFLHTWSACFGHAWHTFPNTASHKVQKPSSGICKCWLTLKGG